MTALLTDLFSSGRAADIVLAVLALEATLLVVRGQPVGAVALTLLPGALMLVALRFALTDAPWPLVWVPLTASFPLHLIDLARRGLLARRPRRP